MATSPEKDCKWYFAESCGGSDQGPTTDSKNEQFRKYPFPSLIRESIQNSLDAQNDSTKPVKVVFTLGSINSRNHENFFDLNYHIKGIFDLYPEPQVKTKFKPMLEVLNNFHQASNRIHYLKVSDFNTKGMSYERKGEVESGTFYAFARCVGYNQKSSETAGGSFGIGKDAIFRISPINTVLVSSLNTKGQYVFEGICLLCTHMFNGKKCRETGYYDNENGFPCTNPNKIPSRFKRDNNNEPGTDIFIMGIDYNKRDEYILEMQKAVLQNFWLAIFKGYLEVEFLDTSNPLFIYSIDSTNLESQMSKLFPESVDKKRQNNYTYNPRPYYEAVAKSGLDKKHVLYEEKLPTLGKCKLYINKTIGNNNPDRIAYMNSINLFVTSQLNKTQYGFSAVFECLSPKGQKLLKRLENISHNEWDANNFRTIYNEVDPLGKVIVSEYSDFIARCISEEFLSLEDSALGILEAENYLFYPEELIESDDLNDENWNYSFGAITGETVEEDDDNGVSITSSIIDDTMPGLSSQKNTGKVVSVSSTTASKSDISENEEPMFGGVPHPGGGNPGELASPGEDEFSFDEDGISGSFRRKINVRYRSIAKYDKGKYVHWIIIHSPRTVDNVEIEITTRGETGDIIIPIKSSDDGIPKVNLLSNVILKQGSNLLSGIVFEDNLKHPISLTTYEIK